MYFATVTDEPGLRELVRTKVEDVCIRTNILTYYYRMKFAATSTTKILV